MTEETSSTARIIKAASACVWREGAVLLARRGKALGQGLWSLPGGKLEPGETAHAAASRELLEETGVVAQLIHEVGVFHIAAGSIAYEITCFAGMHQSGEAQAASDSDAVAWVLPDALQGYPLAPNTEAAVQRARLLLNL
jgi:8-oxo-dGTP pyrophosphatase MutT (NUDIX family)